MAHMLPMVDGQKAAFSDTPKPWERWYFSYTEDDAGFVSINNRDALLISTCTYIYIWVYKYVYLCIQTCNKVGYRLSMFGQGLIVSYIYRPGWSFLGCCAFAIDSCLT